MAVHIFKYYSSSYQASSSPVRCSSTLKYSQIATVHLKSKRSKGARRRLNISCSSLYGDKDELRKQKRALEALLKSSQEAGAGLAPTCLKAL